ncbi:spore gernimation protein GerPD [Halobacillus naozhouensis]|uniref:Spore gernimation protein GerPD n=1 Tax=Halobacillus naozhouensis TaxID=554880 RepID=A0ABY8J0V2_9BACI|nr:spore gernimation protein GerPD [Halobacillus naozhouensis]WFT76127.1 spore gernimation protein GerPD [Halobacillus naozhouensis]
MNYTVYNYGLHVGKIDVTGVASSSVFLVGDSETIRLQSFFDTPPESLIIGPFVPIEEEGTFVEERSQDEG